MKKVYDQLVKVNNGKSKHMAHTFVNVHGAKIISTYCGSGEGKGASAFYTLPGVKVNEETITCKKCLKKFNSMK